MAFFGVALDKELQSDCAVNDLYNGVWLMNGDDGWEYCNFRIIINPFPFPFIHLRNRLIHGLLQLVLR